MRRWLLVVILGLTTISIPGFPNAATSGAGARAGTVRGDFDGNGFDDLAIGVPGDQVSGIPGAGSVNVLYGRSTGLSAQGDDLWNQASAGIADAPQGSVSGGSDFDQPDRFGAALAAGDFDGDGFDDLAVGVPFEDVAADEDEAGAVNVIYGGRGGLAAAGDQFFHQDSPGINDQAEPNDVFGAALVAADFNRDGRDDLAIGIRGETVDVITGAGAVAVLYGKASGLTATGDQFWHQDSPGVNDTAESGDAFGTALAAANFGKGAGADLAIGVPNQDVGGVSNAGAVAVLYSGSKLNATGDQLWHQDSAAIADTAEADDNLGWALAAGNFGKGERADLAVGAPNEDVEAISNAGAVNVIYGRTGGLIATGNQFWHQDKPNVNDVAEADDRFGHALASGNLGKTNTADLAIGIPLEEFGTDSLIDTGAVAVLYSGSGLTSAGDQFWHQDRNGILDQAEGNDSFGFTLAAANYGKGGRDDLAVGIHLEDIVAIDDDRGAVAVLYGGSNGLTKTDQFWHQGSPGVAGAAEDDDFFGFFGPCTPFIP